MNRTFSLRPSNSQFRGMERSKLNILSRTTETPGSCDFEDSVKAKNTHIYHIIMNSYFRVREKGH